MAMALVAGLFYAFSVGLVRGRFEGTWVGANVVRTLFTTAAVAALARALFLHGRATADPTTSGRATHPGLTG